ncbi:MAG TPA: hypothetical protein VGE36_18555 [Roseateles sp.]
MLRPLLALTALLPAAALANTDPTPLRAGILIGVGDRIAIVQQDAQVGSHLNRNVQQSMRIGPEVFQHDAVLTTAQALGTALPGVKPVEMPVRPDVQTQPWRVDGERLIVEPVLAGALERAKVGMLVLVEPLSAPAELKLADLTMGQGRLEGLGFYVDNETLVRRIDTGDQAIGFLGLYAYFRTLVVEIPSMKLLCQRRSTDSQTYLADRKSPGTHPWQALSLERKIEDLRGIVRRELGASLKHCLGAGPAPAATTGPSGS